MTLRYLSLFSGIEAATAAWHSLGWHCVGVAEIEPYPCRLLKHYYPTVPNLGDITKVSQEQVAALGRIDLVVFGSPCQDLSVAGKRKGLDGARSGLFFDAVRIIDWARLWGGCRFALWENVFGAFSSNKGRDFAAVVDALVGLGDTNAPPKGWGSEGCAVGPEGMVEWSTLDAQWFGVAQRRRRVFALADFGDWPSRPPILLEPQSLRGDSAPSRAAGEGAACGAGTSTSACRGIGDYVSSSSSSSSLRASGADLGPGREVLITELRRSVLSEGVDFQNCTTTGDVSGTLMGEAQRKGGQAGHGALVASTGDVAHCLNAGGMGRIDYETETMIVTSGVLYTHYSHDFAHDRITDPTGVSPALTAQARAAGGLNVFAYSTKLHNTTSNQNGKLYAEYTCALDRSSPPPVLLTPLQVRRLTPRECERLQGFADDYTAIPGAADGPRYKALGNSKAVPVVRWIGQQIEFAWRWF